MKYLVLFLSALLTGCSSLAPVKTVYVPIPVEVAIDSRLLAECQSVPRLSGNTEEDLVRWAGDWKTRYTDCKNRHQALVDSLTQQQVKSK
jgi:hypothetical protein